MHIALIPARRDSKGFPFKNRTFFEYTSNFLDQNSIWEKIIVSSNDEEILKIANSKNYKQHRRSEDLSTDVVGIKPVFESVINDLKLNDSDILWLFYLPIIYKDIMDFKKGVKIIENGHNKSLCSFIEAKTHPYTCWYHDRIKNKMKQYIPNDVFRRQDKPPAWEYFHYVYCCRVSELPLLNNELLNENTAPLFLTKETQKQLIEIDTANDYEQWKGINGG